MAADVPRTEPRRCAFQIEKEWPGHRVLLSRRRCKNRVSEPYRYCHVHRYKEREELRAEPHRSARAADLPDPLPGEPDRLGNNACGDIAEKRVDDLLVSILDGASDLPGGKLKSLDNLLGRCIHVTSILPAVSNRLYGAARG